MWLTQYHVIGKWHGPCEARTGRSADSPQSDLTSLCEDGPGHQSLVHKIMLLNLQHNHQIQFQAPPPVSVVSRLGDIVLFSVSGFLDSRDSPSSASYVDKYVTSNQGALMGHLFRDGSIKISEAGGNFNYKFIGSGAAFNLSMYVSLLVYDHGFAMTWSLCDHHPGEARMTCGLRPHHGEAMTWSQSDHQTIVWAKPTLWRSHDMVAKRPSDNCVGEAHIMASP
jgi:hypothetical protein